MMKRAPLLDFITPIFMHIAFLAFATLLILLSPLVMNTDLAYSQSQFSRTYITPFPERGRYKLYIVGSTFAQGMYGGMKEAFAKDRDVEIKSHIKYSSGLAVSRGFNWQKEIKMLSTADKIHVMIIMIGLKERSGVTSGKKWYKLGTEKWQSILGKRIDKLLKTAKSKKIAVYWVGLPIMKSPKRNEEMQRLNDVFRKHAFINGVKFIDTWNGFTDQFNRYSAFGPDINGNLRRIRVKDGIHLTSRGYRKLAHFVEKEIRRDIKLAKSERNIPLAGSKEEQSRISKDVSKKPKIAKRYANLKNKDKHLDKKEKDKGFFARFLGSGDKKKEQKKKRMGTIIEGVEIIRPPLPDIVLSGSGVRNNPAAANAITGDVIANDIGSGLTALASVTSANDLSVKNVKRRVPIKQTPYYRVLVQGETLQPQPGRADDFAWKK